jgi:hypothetical protein
MKKLLLLLLLAIPLFGQSNLLKMEKPKIVSGSSQNLDGSSEYASVVPSLRLTGEYALQDNFSDGDYNGWTVSSGAYTVDNLVANPLSANQYSLKCTTAGIISIPCNSAYGKWSFDLYKDGASNITRNYFIKSDIGSTVTGQGYYFLMGESEELNLLRQNVGPAAQITKTVNSYISNTTYYHIDIYRNTNGSFSTYISGGAFGSTPVLVSVSGGSGSNPVIDNTYTSSNYFVLDLDSGDRFSNLVVEYGEGSLDLNSYEMTKFSFDRDGSGPTNWTSNGNHTIVDSSTTDKRTGAYSYQITSSAIGDATTNYASLASDKIVTIVAGRKYTVEAWARGSGVLGNELITNSADRDFSSDTGFWTRGTGITIADNVCYFNTASTVGLRRNLLISSGKTYTVVFTISYTSGGVRLWVGGNSTSTTYSASGTYTKTIISDGLSLVFESVGATVLDIDNVSIKEVTLPSATFALGSQTKTISSISCVPGTFTKLVWNFQATSAEVGQDLRVFLNQADILFLDDVSISQSWDGMTSVWAKKDGLTSNNARIIRHVQLTKGYNYRIDYMTGVTTANAQIFADGTVALTQGGNVTDNQWHLITATINRAGVISLYVDGVLKGTPASATNVGNLFFDSFGIGVENLTAFFAGETQIVKFYDIANSNVNSTTLMQAYRNGIPSVWRGGIVVGHWKFRGNSDADFLKDYSGLGNNLSGTNVTASGDRVISNYPSK